MLAESFCREPIRHVDVRPAMTVDELVRGMRYAGFGAGRLARAVDIYEQMLRDKALIVLGFAGAMVPAEMKKVVVELIKRRMIHVIVSTGANMVHDILEACGGAHYRGTPHIDDKKLFKHQIDRIFDVFIPEDYFKDYFDKLILKVLDKIAEKYGNKPLSTPELLREIGSELKDENSIVYNAYKFNVPIFVPAVQDSCIGLTAWEYEFKHGGKHVVIDAFKELSEFISLISRAERLGAIIIGGGVPKNYIFQTAFELKRPYDYAIQITMDRPEIGGLSGATLEEAVSWGKVGSEAARVQVIGDATICFPIIAAAIIERMKKAGWKVG